MLTELDDAEARRVAQQFIEWLYKITNTEHVD
jgi:hypothetical protein